MVKTIAASELPCLSDMPDDEHFDLAILLVEGFDEEITATRTISRSLTVNAANWVQSRRSSIGAVSRLVSSSMRIRGVGGSNAQQHWMPH
jgi:hypothetical protein